MKKNESSLDIEVFAMILVHHWYLYLYIYIHIERYFLCAYIYICTHLKQNLIWGQFWGPIWPPLLYTAPRSSDSIPICLEQPMVGRKSFTNLLQLLGFPYSQMGYISGSSKTGGYDMTALLNGVNGVRMILHAWFLPVFCCRLASLKLLRSQRRSQKRDGSSRDSRRKPNMGSSLFPDTQWGWRTYLHFAPVNYPQM